MIYYACEAYPKLDKMEVINSNQCIIKMRFGSLCDSPQKFMDEFKAQNPNAEIGGYSLSKA